MERQVKLNHEAVTGVLLNRVNFLASKNPYIHIHILNYSSWKGLVVGLSYGTQEDCLHWFGTMHGMEKALGRKIPQVLVTAGDDPGFGPNIGKAAV